MILKRPVHILSLHGLNKALKHERCVGFTEGKDQVDSFWVDFLITRPEQYVLRYSASGPSWWVRQVKENWQSIRQEYWLATGKWLSIDPPVERVVRKESTERKGEPRKKRSSIKAHIDAIIKNIKV